MTSVTETILIALGPGTFEGLLAVAIVLTYRSSGVVNCALGSIGALGAVLAALLVPASVPVFTVVTGVLISAVCSGACSAGLARYDPVRRYPLSLLITAGVGVLLFFVLIRTWRQNLEFPVLLPDRLVGLGAYQTTYLQVAGVVAGVLATAAAAALVHDSPRTTTGRRTPSEPAGGLDRNRTWGLLVAGAIAGLSACFTAETGFGPDFMLIPALVALLAACIARFRSPTVAFVAAVAVEVVRNLSIHYKVAHSGYTVAFAGVLLLAVCLSLLLYAVSRASGTGRRARQQHLDY